MALYHIDDRDRLHMSWKGGKGFASFQDSVDASTQLEEYIKKAWRKADYSDQKQ